MKKISRVVELDIEQGNELLAKFVGGFIANRSKKKPLLSFKDVIPFCEAIKYTTQGDYLVYREDLLFHESWDWLMPVIEKIAETHDFMIQFYDGDCNCYCQKQNYGAHDMTGIGHGGFKPNIHSVYWSAVAFVEDYNKNKF
jgi:hypothetical protein